MYYTTKADSYIGGNSKMWKNWQSIYDDSSTCEPCEDKHGQIYPYDTVPYIPLHLRCRCAIIPMRTVQVGTATEEGFAGADAWLMYEGCLPDNYVTKEEAERAGWVPKKQNLSNVLPGKQIGGEIFFNRENKLPSSNSRVWYEADLDYTAGFRGAKRIFYSNDGLIFISYDHAHTFYELVK